MSENVIKARFTQMMAGRKPAHWAKRYFISNGTLSRLSENSVPGPDILSVMMRAENVNINWLLGLDTRPFMIDTHIDQISFIDFLNYHSEDSDYRLDYLLADNLKTLVVAFSQPASMQFKGNTLGYKQLELLAGPLNASTLNALQTLKERHAHSDEFVLSDIQTRQLLRGEFGTYLLFGDTDKTGLIPKGIQSEANTKITELVNTYGSGKTAAGLKQAIAAQPAQFELIDQLHSTLTSNNLNLLPSQMAAVASILVAIGVTKKPTFEQIKSAAHLANVPL